MNGKNQRGPIFDKKLSLRIAGTYFMKSVSILVLLSKRPISSQFCEKKCLGMCNMKTAGTSGTISLKNLDQKNFKNPPGFSVL